MRKRSIVLISAGIAVVVGLSALLASVLTAPPAATASPAPSGMTATPRGTENPAEVVLATPIPLPMPMLTASPTPTPTPTPTPEPTPTVVKMSVTGDLMCHLTQMDSARQADGTYDFTLAFRYVKKYLSDADYTIGNLETTFGGPKYGHKGYPMFSAPDEYGDALKDAGFDFLSTANNHTNDTWDYGILRTLEVLDGLGIEHTGSYATQEARDEIFVKEINGMTFAFVAYTYGTNGLELEAPYMCNVMEDGAALAADIRKARAMNPDFVIVMPHMGNEYELAPNQIFRNWADLMFDAGADIILASHPHVLQPVEFSRREDENGVTRDCFIIYSLGNFVSGQRDTPREAGVILNLYFERAPEDGARAVLKQVGCIPTWVKYVNSTGAFDITVLPVRDALLEPETSGADDLRPQDVARLWSVHAETTKMLLGESMPDEDIQLEYILPGWAAE